VTAADIVADGLRRAGARRAFVADGADATLVAAVRAAGIPIVEVPGAGPACVMAAITGRVGDAPGLAIIAAADDAVRGALTGAARERAPFIVLASDASPIASDPSSVKAAMIAGAESVAHWVAHAAQAAIGEPQGCAWLAVAPDVARAAALPVATAVHRPAEPIAGGEVDELARTIGGAARPLIVAGRGCRARATAPWLRALAEALPAPVLVTPGGRGALPDPHPLCHGLLAGDAPVLSRADLVLALGVDDDELAAAGVALAAPIVRAARVGALLEEFPPRLRDRARADWDVAELDRLRRARRVPDVDPQRAALVRHMRETTPAGTAAVFARPLAALAELWQAVEPGELVIDDDVLAASVAVSLERPGADVLAFGVAPGDGLARVIRSDASRVVIVALGG
jgi:acetolactate synthase-1/2/3 large subunit